MLEALVKKGLAICDLIEGQTIGSNNGFATVSSTDSEAIVSEESLNEIDAKLRSPTSELLYSDLNEVYSSVAKLIDPYDPKVAKLTERHAMLYRHFGRALKLLAKLQEQKASEENDQKTIEVLRRLSWTHIESALIRSMAVKYPKNYRLF